MPKEATKPKTKSADRVTLPSCSRA